MNELEYASIIQTYIEEVLRQLATRNATEHSYRPGIKDLLNALDESIEAINEPKQSEHGAPDFVIIAKKNKDLKLGYGEAKTPGDNLDKIEKSEQMDRYKGYANLFLTDCFDWRFFRNGERIFQIKIGELNKDKTEISKLYTENYSVLAEELANFLSQTPENIRSGKRLAEIMGGKARRIRDNILLRNKQNPDIEGIYELMKRSLVHDLDQKQFADMYAQTLVYGLFVARYSDISPAGFTRQEARDLVPRSNPFLRKFFDHIAGADFDTRLGYIVDELCDVFQASNVAEIVHKHLRIQDESFDAKDPIIHFYEDFLEEYDSELRKRMGAYYTPVPIVRYIVRQIDSVLKEEFGIAKGLASTETITRTVDTQPWRKMGERKDRTTKEVILPRVQILDPAVGTATFLNETIKFIYESFKGQEGQWPSYVNDNLLERIHGFELMMAPYTIAHLKLGMTLKELGVNDLTKRLGVYLTNTLEAGDDVRVDIFSALGLAGAVSEESRLAAIVKNESPVMVVVGNPPYSGVSSNETEYANSIIKKYKVEPGGMSKLDERKHWLNDDYVKFIAFAENMVAKNDGGGVVSMITNNGYLDNPTFRGMRWELRKTFDKIYVLDLHGNIRKHETCPDGSVDENVFDTIQQGVGIILAVKTAAYSTELAKVYHAELYGKRRDKYASLGSLPEFVEIDPQDPNHYFVPKNTNGEDEFKKGIRLDELFIKNTTGVVTGIDRLSIFKSPGELKAATDRILESADPYAEFGIKDSRRASKEERVKELREAAEGDATPITYRPFDINYMYYTTLPERWINSPRFDMMANFIGHNNLGLISIRQPVAANPIYFDAAFVVDGVVDLNFVRRGSAQVFPLYLYHHDGTHDPNFKRDKLKKLVANLSSEPSPENVFDYIYAILHSPSYREKYKEFLKSDFSRVPIPTQAEFDSLVPLGRELRELHLMKSSVVDEGKTIFPEVGSNIVEKPSYADNKVWINNVQYFGDVPELVWSFYIGGYQPAQKWLADRKGRVLTHEDINHYQRIIKILFETDRIMKRIG
jgi:predicted helicase